jgi:hypothetical protein
MKLEVLLLDLLPLELARLGGALLGTRCLEFVHLGVVHSKGQGYPVEALQPVVLGPPSQRRPLCRPEKQYVAFNRQRNNHISIFKLSRSRVLHLTRSSIQMPNEIF